MAVFVRRSAPRSAPLDKAEVRRLVASMLDHLGLNDSELSILLCDDARIQEMNRQHRGIDKATDVLSFPQAEFRSPGVLKRGQNVRLLGDIVISIDTASRQAKARRRRLIEEVRFLLAHGLLHLYGYDHGSPEEKAEMTRRTRQLVRAASLD